MPKRSKTPPNYCLHKGSGQAVVYVDGKAVYLGVHGSPQSHRRYQEHIARWHADEQERQRGEAEASVEAAEAELAAAVNPRSLREKLRSGRAVIIDELIYVFWRHADAYYVKNGKPTREAGLIKEATRPLGLLHGDEPVDSFGPVKLDELRQVMIEDFDWGRSHINKQVSRMIRMFKWGAGQELCSAETHLRLSSLGGLKRGRCEARETDGVDCVCDEHIDQTLPHLPRIVAAMVRCQRLLGARPSEVCAIRPCDIDRSGDVWVYRPQHHKNEHLGLVKEIYIGPRAQQLLAPYLDRPAEACCFSPAETIEETRERQRVTVANARRCPKPTSVPKWEPGNEYQVASYRIAVRRACKKAGIPVWTPGQLRHTAGTFVREKYGLEGSQVFLGHRRADVTQVYAERNQGLGKLIAREMG